MFEMQKKNQSLLNLLFHTMDGKLDLKAFEENCMLTNIQKIYNVRTIKNKKRQNNTSD
jgi:hypothetical protein